MAEIDRIVVIDIEQEGGSTDTPGQEAVRIKADLISTDPSKGAAMVGYRPSDGYPPLTVGNSLNSVQKEISSNKTRTDDAFSKAETANAKASQALINAGNSLQRSSNLTDVVNSIESLKNIGGYPISGSSNTPGSDKVPYSVSDGKLSTDWFKDLTYDLAEMKATLDSIRYPDGIVPYIDADFTLGVLHPLVTFSRASETTYFDKYGTLRTAGINEPAFDHDPETLKPLGIQRFVGYTNLIVDSNFFSSFVHTGVSRDLSGEISPNKIDRMVKVVPSTNNVLHRVSSTVTVKPNTTYSFKFFAKSDGYDFIAINGASKIGVSARINVNTGEIVASTTGTTTVRKLSGGIFEVNCFGRSAATPHTEFYIQINRTGDTVDQIYEGDGTSGINLFGFQLVETVSDFPYFPYIPTSTSQVTRGIDTLTISETSITTKDYCVTLHGNIPAGMVDFPRLLDIRSSTDGLGLFTQRSLQSVGITGRGSSGILSDNTSIQGDFGLSWDVKRVGMSLSVNGRPVIRDAANRVGNLSPASFTIFYNTVSGVGQHNNCSGWIKRFRLYAQTLPDSKLRELSVK